MKGRSNRPPPRQKELLSKNPALLGLTNCLLVSCTVLSVPFFIIKLFFRLKLPKVLLLIHYILVMHSFNLHQLLLLQSGNIEINPGLKKFSRLYICHWHLNGTAAHGFLKVPLIEAFTKVNNIGIISLSGLSPFAKTS